MITVCAMFPVTLHNTILSSVLCIVNSNRKGTSVIRVYMKCALLVGPHTPQLLHQTCSTKLSWGFISSAMWQWVITWDIPDASTSRQQTTSRVSQTTHLRTQCHMLHNTAVTIWTPARKCHLATVFLALANFFSCLQLPPWWYGYVAGGVCGWMWCNLLRLCSSTATRLVAWGWCVGTEHLP